MRKLYESFAAFFSITLQKEDLDHTGLFYQRELKSFQWNKDVRLAPNSEQVMLDCNIFP